MSWVPFGFVSSRVCGGWVGVGTRFGLRRWCVCRTWRLWGLGVVGEDLASPARRAVMAGAWNASGAQSLLDGRLE